MTMHASEYSLRWLAPPGSACGTLVNLGASPSTADAWRVRAPRGLPVNTTVYLRSGDVVNVTGPGEPHPNLSQLAYYPCRGWEELV